MKHPCLMAGLLLCLVVCGVDEETTPSPHTVSYTFGWQSEEAIVSDASITLQTDLGYEVSITRGYAIAYTVSLVECSEEEAPVELPGMGRWLWNLLTPRVAWAGHSYGNDNEAAVGVAHTEDIIKQETWLIDTKRVDPGNYCQFFYLIGRADSATVGLPDEPDLSGMSLYFEGSYSRPGEESQDFVIHTTRAYSLVSELYGLGDYGQVERAFQIDTGAEGAEVMLTRNLDRLFDGVDFETMNRDQRATQVLQGLIDHAELSVVVTP